MASAPAAEAKEGPEASTSGIVVPGSLLECAACVMNTADCSRKAELTELFAAEWFASHLPSSATPPMPVKPADRVGVPSSPARPKITSKKRGGKRTATVHALVHAESFAIDLSWDIMLRFGQAGDVTLKSEGQFVGKEGKESKDETEDGGKTTTFEVPLEFFHDWTRVAQEEAKHFRKWKKRLQELGSDYGEIECHNGLWESATTTSDSLLSRLGIVHMVHEARGLDVFPTMVARFERAGDAESETILRANYAEEIFHVGFGVKWFKVICEHFGFPTVDTYHSVVKSRFRGFLKPPFNDEARATAGMTPEWYLGLVKE